MSGCDKGLLAGVLCCQLLSVGHLSAPKITGTDLLQHSLIELEDFFKRMFFHGFSKI